MKEDAEASKSVCLFINSSIWGEVRDFFFSPRRNCRCMQQTFSFYKFACQKKKKKNPFFWSNVAVNPLGKYDPSYFEI